MTDPKPAAVYRCYNDEDMLLHVGVANRPQERWSTHASFKRWWPQVARTEVEWHPTRQAALQAEARAVHAEDPLYNVMIPPLDKSARGTRVRRDVPPVALSHGPITYPVRVPDKVWEQVEEIAKEQGCTKTDVVMEALERQIARYRRQRRQADGRADD